MAETLPVKIGNPHDFRPGPLILSGNADFHHRPADDPIKAAEIPPSHNRT